MGKEVDECTEAIVTIGVDIEIVVVEETFAGPQANTPVAHVLRDDLRRSVAIAA
jgi:hypothetical protein